MLLCWLQQPSVADTRSRLRRLVRLGGHDLYYWVSPTHPVTLRLTSVRSTRPGQKALAGSEINERQTVPGRARSGWLVHISPQSSHPLADPDETDKKKSRKTKTCSVTSGLCELCNKLNCLQPSYFLISLQQLIQNYKITGFVVLARTGSRYCMKSYNLLSTRRELYDVAPHHGDLQYHMLT